jgi:hypothetical protein
MHELGVTLPDFLLVTQHFSEGPIARYPRGSQYIVMQHYQFPSLDFFKRIESYLKYRERRPDFIDIESRFNVMGLRNLLKQILSAHSPPAFQVPIPSSGSYRDLLVTVAQTHEVVRYGARVNPKGTYADKVFIWQPQHKEFEVVLCDFSTTYSVRDRGRV